MRSLSLSSLLILALLASACSPLTRYRQSLMVPAASPTSVVGAPLAGGQVAVAGQASGYLLRDSFFSDDDVTNWFPEEGDPGVFVPRTSLGGHLRWGLTDHLELGATFDYASGGWTERSSLGVLDLTGTPFVMSVGPQLTAGAMFGSLGFGGTLEVNWTELPYAQYEYDGPEELKDLYWFDDAEEFYTLYEVGVCHPWRVRWTNAMQVRHEGFEGAFGFTLAPQFTNTGFSSDREPVYESGSLSVIPVVDLGFSMPGMHVGVQGWYAMNTRGPTNGLQLGPGARLVMEYRSPAKDGS